MARSIGSQQVVIALASHDSGHYATMTRAALSFLRTTSAGSTVTLLVDGKTDQYLRRHDPSLLELSDRTVVDSYQEDSVKAASRALKIRARRLVEGDFVYLDSDAFVIDRLDVVFDLPGDVAFARDVGMERTRFDEDNIWVQEHRRLGWKLTPRHFNGGVFLARDNDRARAFFDQWWRHWKAFQAVGRCVDQPALDQTVVSCHAEVSELPSRFNATFCVEPRLVRSAAVLHFLVSQGTLRSTVLDQILTEVREDGCVRKATIDRLRATRYPWIDPNLPRRQFYAGNYGRACLAAGRRILRPLMSARAAC